MTAQGPRVGRSRASDDPAAIRSAQRWLVEHEAELTREFAHCWIAVALSGGVAAYADTLPELEARIRSQHLQGRVLVSRLEPHASLGL